MSRSYTEVCEGDFTVEDDSFVVVMQTHVFPDCILYTVVNGDPAGGDFSTAIEVWRKVVPFGKKKEFRAGGYHFKQAVREQEQIAADLRASHLLRRQSEKAVK